MDLTLDLSLIEGKKVGLAVSGGADSMALLLLFLNCCPTPFYVINIEHGLRQSSKDDSAYVKQFCCNHNIPFCGFSVDALEYAKANKMSIELAARELRHNIFTNEVKSGKCDLIATAHHLGDQAETIMLRLCRGTGINGLQGIKIKQGHLIRPLINYTKQQLIDFLNEHNVQFRQDETNFLDDYNRNYIRLNIIPKIEERFPAFKENLFKLSLFASESEDFASQFLKEPIPILNGYKILEPFSHPYILKKEILNCFLKLNINQDIELRHLNLILELTKLPNGKKLDMPYDISIYREEGGIAIVKNNKPKDFEIPISELIQNEKLLKQFDLSIKKENQNDSLCCDLDKMPPNAVLRYRKIGDRFTKFGGGTKSLGDFLTDKKIPLRLRDNLLVIADENDILFTLGVEISEKIKIDINTKNFLVFNGGKNVR